MKVAITLLAVSMLVGLVPLQAANSILVDPTADGLLGFAETLVHSGGRSDCRFKYVSLRERSWGRR